MADDLFCVQCGHRNSVGDNFCSACGHRLASGGAGDDLTLTLHPLSPEGEPGRRDITVRVVGEAEGRALNLRYRGKDYPTNVLTFDYAQEPVVMADLVLCGPVIAREAREQRKTLQAHYAHLLVHGTLHAQGWDHETGEWDALEMETLEILLLAALGFDNPY